MSGNRPRQTSNSPAGDDDIRISRRTALAGAAGVVGVAAAAVVAILLLNDDDDGSNTGEAVTFTPESAPPPTATEPPTATAEPPAPTATSTEEAPTVEPSQTPEPTATTPSPTPSIEPTSAPTEPPPTPTVAPRVGWTRLEPSGAVPGGRRDHALVADRAGNDVFLFGGRAGDEPLGDLWRYDVRANTWSELPSDGGPGARFGHNAIYDDTQQLIVVFGGQAGSDFFGDVWVYDPVANVWAEVGQSDLDAAPDARYGAAGSVQASGSGLYISHGFTSAGRFDDSWLFNVQDGSWRKVSPDNGLRPVPRCLTRMATDPDRDRLLLFGGQSDDAPYLGDLWAFDTASDTWLEIETNNPPARNLFSLVRNPDNGELILFGGASASGLRGDVWFLSVEDDVWRAEVIDPSISPLIPPRDSHDAVWLGQLGVMLMFGGQDGNGMLGDLWIYAP